MTGSSTETASVGNDGKAPADLWKPITEWLVWIAIAGLAYSQTGVFDREIAEYAFGASGWPRALCIAVVIGATGQLVYQLAQRRHGAGSIGESAPAKVTVDPTRRLGGWRLVQRLGIFLFPLLYLYVIPTVGFYLATPVFLIGMLLILEVKSPLALVTVTAIVYGLFLLVFTRFFYVAVPVGQEPFYSLNNAIIIFARTGV